MSNHKFTPGPWEAIVGARTEPECQSVIMTEDTVNGGRRRIALVDCEETNVKRGKTIGTEEDPVRDANALLISGAPELFSVLEKLKNAAKRLDCNISYYIISEEVEAAEKVLKKYSE